MFLFGWFVRLASPRAAALIRDCLVKLNVAAPRRVSVDGRASRGGGRRLRRPGNGYAAAPRRTTRSSLSTPRFDGRRDGDGTATATGVAMTMGTATATDAAMACRAGWRVQIVVSALEIPPRLPPDLIDAQSCLCPPLATKGKVVRGPRRAAGAVAAPLLRRDDRRASRPYTPVPIRIPRGSENDERVVRRGAAAQPLPRRRSRRPPPHDARPSTDTRPIVPTRETTQRPRNEAAARGETRRTNHPTRTIPQQPTGKARN